MKVRTVIDTEIVWYGPHPCDECGQMIVQAGRQWGKQKLTAPPSAMVYPNHVWKWHNCPGYGISSPPEPPQKFAGVLVSTPGISK